MLKHGTRVINRISSTNLIVRRSQQAAATSRTFQYLDEFEVKNGVGIVRFNGPNKMNTISEGLQTDVERLFKEKIIDNPDIKALVFTSSKSDNFIAGADIEMLKAVENKKDLKDLTMKGHAFFDYVKKHKNVPTVAAIHGAALGGGLEWALYCDYRIATSSSKTVLGLPEMKLGLLPGMGGTYHLPKLVGLQASLDMILTGKNIKPDKAKKMGLVDLVVDQASLEQVAIDQALGLAAGTVKKTHLKKSLKDKLLEDTPLRHMVFNIAKKKLDKLTGGFYPAPYTILDVIQTTYGKDRRQALDYEATKFAELAATKESEALIGIFLGMSAVKKHDFKAPEKPVKKIAVLGAGLMGSGIAQVSVDNGKYEVLLKDKDAAGVSRGLNAIDEDMKSKLKKKKFTNHQYVSTISRLTPLHDGIDSWKRHFASADLVIEAVFEDINVKHRVIKEMESVLPPHAIFASNTSAIPIGRIAEGSSRPERVIGMHYFSPVPKMPLIEIIPHAGTAPEVSAAAIEVGSKQGKTPILVKDVPGFFVNRCLSPFTAEVSALIQEGVDLEFLDGSMKKFGMPVGPITLSDEVGIDIATHVAEFMSKADLGVRMAGGDTTLMKKMIEQGWLGRKSGKGFYLYPKVTKKGEKKQLNPELVEALRQFRKEKGLGGAAQLPLEDVQYRIISRFINEAAYCLQDGIIRSPVDGDIGAVFGIGFPPFYGGPFRMLDTVGLQSFLDRMYRYRDAKGLQFEPAQILKDYAAQNKKFHPK